MHTRRNFLKNSAIVGGLLGLPKILSCDTPTPQAKTGEPLVISTWEHGIPANEAAWKLIGKGGKAIDAVEAGVRVVESDPKSTSVGYGGLPDRDGKVTLDACIMDETGNAGSVCFLQHIENPISVARKVMDDTPHVMLAGEGALKFALENGFQKKNLLTADSEKEWREWLKTSEYKPIINVENHDTIGLLAMDKNGDLSGACTTSGLAYKMHGRVGDSPIIGAGLYVDNEVGAATATGMGELMMKTLGSFLVVELMRQGATAQEACQEAVMRIVRKLDYKEMQVAYLAIDKAGNTGAYAIHPGFNYAIMQGGKNELIDAVSYS